MGVHEVTQAEYLAVTRSNPSFFAGDLNRPVETVSWNSAAQIKFLNRLIDSCNAYIC